MKNAFMCEEKKKMLDRILVPHVVFVQRWLDSLRKLFGHHAAKVTAKAAKEYAHCGTLLPKRFDSNFSLEKEIRLNFAYSRRWLGFVSVLFEYIDQVSCGQVDRLHHYFAYFRRSRCGHFLQFFLLCFFFLFFLFLFSFVFVQKTIY